MRLPARYAKWLALCLLIAVFAAGALIVLTSPGNREVATAPAGRQPEVRRPSAAPADRLDLDRSRQALLAILLHFRGAALPPRDPRER